MPTYEYVCTACANKVEVSQSFTDPPLEVCEVCGGKLRKVFHAVGIQLKGGGFYSSERRAAQPMRRKDAAKEDKRSDSTSESSGAEKSESKGESKRESQRESKSESKRESKSESKGESKPAASESSKSPSEKSA